MIHFLNQELKKNYKCFFYNLCSHATQITVQKNFIYPPPHTTWWCSWLRHCTTRQKVTGSIPNGVTGIFHWHNPSGCTMALVLTWPQTEMRTRNISWRVKAACAYGWQPYHFHEPTAMKSGSLNLLEPSGPVQACNGIALPFTPSPTQYNAQFSVAHIYFNRMCI